MGQQKNNIPKPIGFVSSTLSSPANESFFSFILRWEENNQVQVVLNPLDIVKVSRTALPSKSYLYASVISVQAISDAPDHVANFVSSNFGQGTESKMRRLMFFCVSAKVIYSESGTFFPVQTGDPVFLCTKGEEVYTALYANYNGENGSYFPIAQFEMYKGCEKALPLSAMLNSKYVFGPDSAHINISGMSGMASKTTKAMIILRQLFYADGSCKIVIFNTKDTDLMKIEHKTPLEGYSVLDGEEKDYDSWNASIMYLEPHSQNNQDGYVFDLSTQRKNHNLDLLVAMDPDESGTMDSCTKAMEDSEEKNWEEFSAKVSSNAKPNDTPKEAKKENQNNNPYEGYPVPRSWQKYLRVFRRVYNTREGIFTDSNGELLDLSKQIESFLQGNLTGKRVLVVDLHSLEPLQQAVVFGCAIRQIKTECKGVAGLKVAVFIDELNKYASVDTTFNSPILENLIDLAETGRSNGICLITAEQSLSVINKRIKANFATTIYGKTSAVELTQFDYQLIPDSLKSQVGTFSHGDSLISTPTLNSGLLKANFPDKFYSGGK